MAGLSIFGQGGPSSGGLSGATDPGIFAPGHDPGATVQPNGSAQPSNRQQQIRKKRPGQAIQSIFANSPQAQQMAQIGQLARLGGTAYADQMDQLMMNPSNSWF